MIIWSGFGIVVGAIGIVSLIATEITLEALTNNERFYQEHPWGILLAMVMAAVLTYGFHLLLSLEKPRVMIDKETGREIARRTNHSMFFIPVKVWPVLFVILGLVVTVVQSVKR